MQLAKLILLMLMFHGQLFSQCPSGQWALGVVIIQDSYPGETTWNVLSNGVQVGNGSFNSDTVCVDSSHCINFQINDSYGDGICCGYGNGSYVISLNGIQVASGGQFTYTASHSFNCAPGTICENPLTGALGLNLAQQENTFYEFTPDSTGIYEVTTCNLSTCDTRLWLYDQCADVDLLGSSSGALYYNDDNQNCGFQADLHPFLTGGATYIIKVGLKANTSCIGPIPFSISYEGPMSSVLPIVLLNTVSAAINNDVKVPVHMQIIDNGPGQLNYANQNNFAYEGDIMAELQGFTGPSYPKKNYDFDLIDSVGNKIDTSLLNLPAENDWIFKAEYLDATLLKNTVAYEFSRKMGQYAPRTRPCEIFLDGQFLGYYTLTEKVKRSSERVKIAKLNPQDIIGVELTGGYIIEMNITGAPAGWYSNFLPINYASSGQAVEFKHVYPKSSIIEPEQANYIHGFVDSFENALSASSYLDLQWGYRNWIDPSTFIDFLIVNEYSMNYDSYGRSTYMYKEKITDGGKLKIGPPWDYDRAMDSNPNSGWVWEITHPYWPFPFWWSKMFTDPTFTRELACRWYNLRQDVFKTSEFTAFIDSASAVLLQGPADRNNMIWQVSGGNSYSQIADNLKTFMIDRLEWMDQALAPFFVPVPGVPWNYSFNYSGLPSDTLVCRGTPFVAPFVSGLDYNWTPGPDSSAIQLDTTGLYVLEVTDIYGCKSKETMSVQISEPDSMFVFSNVASEFQFTANDSGLQTYFWNFGDQTQNANSGYAHEHAYANIGFYTVNLNVSDSLGCMASSSQTVYVQQGQIQIEVSPNPLIGQGMVSHNIPLDDDYSFVLMNALGQKIQVWKSPPSPFDLHSGELASGMYFLVCLYQNQTIEKKIISLN